jgi:transcriptional antiterminator
MGNENKILKLELLSLFNNGKSEEEAYEEISKTQYSDLITLSVVNKWFEEFKSGVDTKVTRKTKIKYKFTDGFLINLVNENPDLNLKQLGKFANCTARVISARLKQINADGEVAKYSLKACNKGAKKLSDEFIISLVNENPDLNLKELAKLANVSAPTISKRLKTININGESAYYRVNVNNKGAKLLTDESLIKIINENPGLNLKELAKLANCTVRVISARLKKINADGEVVKYKMKSYKRRVKELSDEFIINLINENPNLYMSGLAKLAGISAKGLSNRLKKIDIDGESAYYRVNVNNKGAKLLTDESLIKIINENPDLNLMELTKLTNTKLGVISYRIKRINRNGDRVKYNKKTGYKFTDESFINLINSNPNLNIRELSELVGTTPETLSSRMKKINRDEQLVNYSKKGSQNGVKKFSDEFLINLIKENPGLNTIELSNLAGTSQPTISNRLREINSKRSEGDKIVLQKGSAKLRNSVNSITDEYLIKLVNDNPNLNIKELAEISNTSFYAIWKKLKDIENNGDTINYKSKKKKFTNEFLIQLINDNPELNIRELAKLTGSVPSTVLYRINQINSEEQVVNYCKKHTVNKNKTLTDVFLIELVNDNPGLTMKELAKLANVTTSAISRRLKKINMEGERVVYTMKNRSSNSKSAKS